MREFPSTHGCFVCTAHSPYHGVKNDSVPSLCGMDKGFSFHASFTASYDDFTESAPMRRQREEQQGIYCRWEMRHQFHFHCPAEHWEQDCIALEKRSRREKMLCVCGHLLDVFTEMLQFNWRQALPIANLHGNGRSGFNRSVWFWKIQKMFILERRSQVQL